MTIAFFSCQPYEQPFLEAVNANHRHQLLFLPQALTTDTVLLAAGCSAVCVFVNDQLTRPVLQGLADSHVHEFTVNGVRIGQPLDEFDQDFGEGLIDEATVTLGSVLTQVDQKFDYTYDFGDSWDHVIVVEKWLPGNTSSTYPVCTGGKLKCPPEDCGGIPGFYEMLPILKDKRHPERAEMLKWLGGPYNVQAFDQTEVNQQLLALSTP